MTTAKCKKQVYVNSWAPPKVCGRNVKGQTDSGEWMCGIHLAAWRRRKKTDDAYKAARGGSESNKARAALACEILAEMGIEAREHYQHAYNFGDGGHTGKVIIDPTDLFKFIGVDITLQPIQNYRKSDQ